MMTRRARHEPFLLFSVSRLSILLFNLPFAPHPLPPNAVLAA
jgi:hypothetical protein